MNLLPKIARGDLQALELLYQQHKTKVYRLALSLTADPYLAEDITQETFLRIQEHAPSYRRDISETAWIVTIARNLSYDALRRRRKEVLGDPSAQAEDPDSHYSSSLSHAISANIGASEDSLSSFYFLELLEPLTDKEKEVVSLRILADLPWNEIGKITCQSGDACRKRYTRALEKLRDQLTS